MWVSFSGRIFTMLSISGSSRLPFSSSFAIPECLFPKKFCRSAVLSFHGLTLGLCARPSYNHHSQKDGLYQLAFSGTHAYPLELGNGSIVFKLLRFRGKGSRGGFLKKNLIPLLEEGHINVVQSKAIFVLTQALWPLQGLSEVNGNPLEWLCSCQELPRAGDQPLPGCPTWCTCCSVGIPSSLRPLCFL